MGALLTVTSKRLYRVLTLTANYNLRQDLGLTTKRRNIDIEKNHRGGKLRQLPSHSNNCRLHVLTHFLGSNTIKQSRQNQTDLTSHTSTQKMQDTKLNVFITNTLLQKSTSVEYKCQRGGCYLHLSLGPDPVLLEKRCLLNSL